MSPSKSPRRFKNSKLTAAEVSRFEQLQSQFTILHENRPANQLILEQLVTKEELLEGLDVSPEVNAQLPDWPQYSDLLKVLCEYGADQRVPKLPKFCPECPQSHGSGTPVLGIICKKPGKAGLYMHHVSTLFLGWHGDVN